MWLPDEIEIQIDELYGDTVLITIMVPIGRIRIIADVAFEGDELHITSAHIEGLSAGDLGRAGLNAIGQRALEMYHVRVLHVKGASRTTGRNPGRAPKAFRFPRVDRT